MMKWMIKGVSLTVVLMAILLYPACVGDFLMETNGTVYEWVDAPGNETSQILLHSELPEDIEVKPLEGASINLYTISYEGGQKVPDSSPFSTVFSEASGDFLNYPSHPSSEIEDYHVKIIKEGYFEASGLLLYEEGPVFQMIVLMVRDDS